MTPHSVGIQRFCLIIGAMKCGTTKLFNDLRSVPELCHSGTKEPNFFTQGDLAAQFPPGTEFEMLSDYRKNWPGWDPLVHSAGVEASVNYAKAPHKPSAATAISRLSGLAEFRFLYVVRNPVDAVSSFYRHAFSSDKRWATQHRIAMLEQDTLSALPLVVYSYARQLDRYRSYFPPRSIKLIDFQKFTDAPSETIADIARFLDLPTDFVFLESSYRHSASDRLAEMRRGFRMSALWRHRSLSNLTDWTLGDAHRDVVVDMLRHDVSRLRDDYGFDTSDWIEWQ